jgi:hypothetical protein
MHSVIASVKFNKSGDDGKGGMLSGDQPNEGNEEVTARETKAESLAGGGPTPERNGEQDQAQENVSDVVRKRVMVIFVTSWYPIERQNSEYDVKDSGGAHEHLAIFRPHHTGSISS